MSYLKWNGSLYLKNIILNFCTIVLANWRPRIFLIGFFQCPPTVFQNLLGIRSKMQESCVLRFCHFHHLFEDITNDSESSPTSHEIYGHLQFKRFVISFYEELFLLIGKIIVQLSVQRAAPLCYGKNTFLSIHICYFYLSEILHKLIFICMIHHLTKCFPSGFSLSSRFIASTTTHYNCSHGSIFQKLEHVSILTVPLRSWHFSSKNVLIWKLPAGQGRNWVNGKLPKVWMIKLHTSYKSAEQNHIKPISNQQIFFSSF